MNSEELNYEVKPVKVTNSAGYNHVDRKWPVDDRVYGYYAGIFGPGWYGDDGYSLQAPALDHLDTRRHDPLDKLWDTPEEAMEAWENASPVKMTTRHGADYFLRQKNVDAINDQRVFRTIMQEEVPFE
jgi:hypothetical protein